MEFRGHSLTLLVRSSIEVCVTIGHPPEVYPTTLIPKHLSSGSVLGILSC